MSQSVPDTASIEVRHNEAYMVMTATADQPDSVDYNLARVEYLLTKRELERRQDSATRM